MKSFIIIALCAAVALAAPQRPAQHSGHEKQAETLRYDNDVGIYKYDTAYETSNGIKSEEHGQLQNEGKENEALVRSGQYTYVAPDGTTYSVQWTADENGYHPLGAHLPQ